MRIFVKDTPILMAGNPLRNTTAAYALAALPIVSVPIQDVQLFDYAVAHKTVNAGYGLTASSDDTYIIGKDLYTSDQQRSRDQYEIKDIDWNEVTFEQVLGSSKCKLALHNDWINDNNYALDAIVNMNLPEQGISGPFRITSIKHILPQKKPESDPSEEYEWKPVTGLFIHQSDQVHNISFDNNETIGVTALHPIFSTTHNDWRLAEELEVGEKVLTYHGEATVTKTEKKGGSEAVYNLEIKDLHNFLVNGSGIVVHNGYIIKECFTAVVDYLKTNVKYLLKGTGKYKTVGGHHPLAKKAFELDPKYDLNEAFSISKETLEEVGGLNVHSVITGKQNSLYSAWRAANPAPAKMSFADMIEIERQAMIQSGIPEDIANGWIVKGVEDLKKQGVTEITNIPWNGVN